MNSVSSSDLIHQIHQYTGSSATIVTHPNIALIKYWGKSNLEENIPATHSLGITLSQLTTKTTVTLQSDLSKDILVIDGKEHPLGDQESFYSQLKQTLCLSGGLLVQSETNFPVAAGLASSSSGLAALVLAAACISHQFPTWEDVIRLTRKGSASAVRSLYGGFVHLPANTGIPEPLYPHDYWDDLRMIIVVVTDIAKTTSSRSGMIHAQATSPFFPSWLSLSPVHYSEALKFLRTKDLDALGNVVQANYLAMFSTMFTSIPPVVYWNSASVELIHLCQELRTSEISAWETMDAGPQVKILCLNRDLENIISAIRLRVPQVRVLTDQPGAGPEVVP